MGATEAFAVAAGAAYIVLAIRRHRACWIAGGASTALYAAVFLDAGLPLQALLQLLYVGLSVYGWFAWRPGAAEPLPRRWPLARHVAALAAVGAMGSASALLLQHHALSQAPWAEALGTWASVMATWLLARRVIDTWLWWIVIDVSLAALFASRGLQGTAALYLAYAVLAVVGWRSWRRAMETAA